MGAKEEYSSTVWLPPERRNEGEILKEVRGEESCEISVRVLLVFDTGKVCPSLRP